MSKENYLTVSCSKFCQIEYYLILVRYNSIHRLPTFRLKYICLSGKPIALVHHVMYIYASLQTSTNCAYMRRHALQLPILKVLAAIIQEGRKEAGKQDKVVKQM